ncbi:MAG TPA: KpsF/GutQ family sugar-phosphate isomerase [Rhodocyclaceae bacterium]|nr:KpsF/GutQ family sugar-phosphate isomerase [Rhodocyclaceae bacterium]
MTEKIPGQPADEYSGHNAEPANGEDLLALARDVLRIEAAAVTAIEQRLDGEFVRAVRLIWKCSGRIVVSGIGKSGHIGNKLASTLASTGTPAFFVHPAEASHGDLGMITGEDLLIAISNSGESEELLLLLPMLKRRGTRLIAMTGNPASTLARRADVHLDASVEREACPLGLAPSASTTATLALGDALAFALLRARGFGVEDFASSHPGGRLGRRLLIRVGDLMHQGERMPWVPVSASVTEALLEMSRKGLGMTAVVDIDMHIAGVFTDGDLRRALARGDDLRALGVAEVMSRQPHTISAERLAAEALNEMESRRINGLLVADDQGRLTGAFNMHDLLRAGVV